eukprot:6472834-Amphidinium_carterae.4
MYRGSKTAFSESVAKSAGKSAAGSSDFLVFEWLFSPCVFLQELSSNPYSSSSWSRSAASDAEVIIEVVPETVLVRSHPHCTIHAVKKIGGTP